MVIMAAVTTLKWSSCHKSQAMIAIITIMRGQTVTRNLTLEPKNLRNIEHIRYIDYWYVDRSIIHSMFIIIIIM